MTCCLHSLGDGSRVRFQFIADEEMVSLQEWLVHARELLSRTDRGSYPRNHWSVPFGDTLQPIAVDPDLTRNQGDWDGQEFEFDARVLAALFSSADRSFRKWEDVVLDSFACNYEDYLVTHQGESDIIAVELAALHHELAVDPLRWFADFAGERHWHSSDAVYQHFQDLIRIWYTDGTYDQLIGVATMEELDRCGSTMITTPTL